jgi:carboxypeptidase family protein
MKSLKSAICKFGFLLLLFSHVSFGQAVYGNIIGTVTDPSGAAVPDAPITVKDLDRGTTYQTTSNASGNFE